MEGAVDFIKWLLNNTRFAKTQLRICTNALRLDCLSREEMRRLKGISVSLDGCGEYYEKVRRGSSWERVSRNLDCFLEEQKHAHGGAIPEHCLDIACTLTHPGLPGLPGLIRWGVERQCGISFFEVRSRMDKDVMAESLAVNVEPLRKSSSGWREIFAECIALCSSSPRYADSVHQLATIRDRIEKSLGAGLQTTSK